MCYSNPPKRKVPNKKVQSKKLRVEISKALMKISSPGDSRMFV